jgi:hypothetical protein
LISDLLASETDADLVTDKLRPLSDDHTVIDEAAENYFDWAVRSRRASVYILDALFPHLPSLFAWDTATAKSVSFLPRWPPS